MSLSRQAKGIKHFYLRVLYRATSFLAALSPQSHGFWGTQGKAPHPRKELRCSLMALNLKAPSLCSQATPIVLPIPSLFSFSFALFSSTHCLLSSLSLPFSTHMPCAKPWCPCPGWGSSCDSQNLFPLPQYCMLGFSFQSDVSGGPKLGLFSAPCDTH